MIRGKPVQRSAINERVLIYYRNINVARMWQSHRFWQEYEKPYWAYILPDLRKSSILSIKLIEIFKQSIKKNFPGLEFYEVSEGTKRPQVRSYIPKAKKQILKAGLKPKPVPEDAHALSFQEGLGRYITKDWRLPDDFLTLRFMDLSGGMKRQFINSVALLASSLEDVLFVGDCPDLYLDAFKSDIFLAWIEKMLEEGHTFILVLTNPYMKEQIQTLQFPKREILVTEGRVESS